MSGLTYPEVEKAIYNKRGQMLIRDKKSDQLLHRFILGATVLAVLSLITIEIQWLKLLSRTDEFFLVLLRLIATSLTPHAWLELPTLWVPLFESLSVTVLATFYSAIIGLFIGALAAPNINQNRWLTMGIHMFFTFLRAVPTPVWVLLYLASLGFGPAAGIMGLGIHATAFFVRMFSQSFEEVPREVIETLEAAGANRLQIFFGAIMPAALSSLVAWFALRLEINFEQSSILGMVGAGGIGYVIVAALHNGNEGLATLAILLVFTCSLSLELLFVRIKKKIM